MSAGRPHGRWRRRRMRHLPTGASAERQSAGGRSARRSAASLHPEWTRRRNLVRNDVIFQAYFNAALILLHGLAPLDRAHPCASSRRRTGFGTFGAPHVSPRLGEAIGLGYLAEERLCVKEDVTPRAPLEGDLHPRRRPAPASRSSQECRTSAARKASGPQECGRPSLPGPPGSFTVPRSAIPQGAPD